MHLLLNADFSAELLDGPQGAPTGEIGHWTMVYDQAIVLEVPRIEGKFMANFRYSVKDSVGPSEVNTLKSGSYEKFDSRCSETMVGVKFDEGDTKGIQCWIGF